MANPRRYLNTHAKRIPQPCPGKCLPSRCSYSSRIDERVIIRFPPLSLSLSPRAGEQAANYSRSLAIDAELFSLPCTCVHMCACVCVSVWSNFERWKFHCNRMERISTRETDNFSCVVYRPAAFQRRIILATFPRQRETRFGSFLLSFFSLFFFERVTKCPRNALKEIQRNSPTALLAF